MYYVYLHTNKINNKKYCGITNNIENRWRNNGIAYKPYSGRIYHRKFWNAIQKYGWDNFEHKILFEVDTDEEAWEKEKEIIEKFRLTEREFGYNIAPGGNGGRIYKEHPKGMLGKHHSEETKMKLSESFSGKNNPFYGKDWNDYGGHPKGMLGKKHKDTTQWCHQVSIKVILQNGDEYKFSNLSKASRELNIPRNVLYNSLRKNKPYKNPQNFPNYNIYNGIRVIKIDNTEVTYETKAS